MSPPGIKRGPCKQRQPQRSFIRGSPRLLLTLLAVVAACLTPPTLSLENISGHPMQQSYEDLHRHVKHCPAMSHKIPPYISEEYEVQVYFEPAQVKTVDELSQTVDISFLLVFWWRQPACAWDPEGYNGIKIVEIESSTAWIPVIINPKSAKSTRIEMPKKLKVDSRGEVYAVVLISQSVYCYMDLTNYPFDDHNCSAIFLEMNGMSLAVLKDSALVGNESLVHFFGTSAEWELLSAGCSAEYFPATKSRYVECWFNIKRRSIFYVATIIFPIALMSFMTLVVFCIPPGSGEKMSFVVSIFVSMTVFINFFVDVVPRSMDKLPVIVELIIVVIVLIGLSALSTSLVLKKYHQEEKEKEKTKRRQEKKYNTFHNDERTITQGQKTNAREFEDTDNYFLKANKTNGIVGLDNLGKDRDFQNRGKLFKAALGRTNKVEVMDTVRENQSLEKGETNDGFAMRPKEKGTFLCPIIALSRLSDKQMDKIFFLVFLIAFMICVVYAVALLS